MDLPIKLAPSNRLFLDGSPVGDAGVVIRGTAVGAIVELFVGVGVVELLVGILGVVELVGGAIVVIEPFVVVLEMVGLVGGGVVVSLIGLVGIVVTPDSVFSSTFFGSIGASSLVGARNI